MKFKDIIPQFLDYKKDYIRDSTLGHYVSVYENHLIFFFGEMNSIRQKDVDEYLYKKAAEGFSKKGLESHIVALKSCLTWANKTGVFVTGKLKANYPSIAKDSVDINPLSVEEARIFAKYCEDNFSFMSFALYTALFTGLRAGELCGLQWKDIDVSRGILSVNKIVTRNNIPEMIRKEGDKSTAIVIGPPKTVSSIREIPLAKQVLYFYKNLSKIMNPDFFVATNKSTPTEPTALRNELAQILALTGLPSIRLHDLRHTFATRCISSGIDPKTVSVLLGHSTVVTTLKIYMHIDDDAKTVALNKLSKKMAWG